MTKYLFISKKIKYNQQRPIDAYNYSFVKKYVLYAVYEDAYNNLWLSSNWGIMRFDKNTKNVTNYVKQNGLIENEFNTYEIVTNLNFESLPELGQSGSRIHFGFHIQLKNQTTWEKDNPNSMDLSYPIKKYIEKSISQPKAKKKWKFWK